MTFKDFREEVKKVQGWDCKEGMSSLDRLREGLAVMKLEWQY